MNAQARAAITPGRRQLFIYWRVAEADIIAALGAVRALHDALRRRHTGLQCALYLRHEPGAPQATLMETYALDAAVASKGLGPALQQNIEAAAGTAVAPWLCGQRHVEVFDAIDG